MMPMSDPQTVVFTFLRDGIAEPGGNESLNLQLIPIPSVLQTMPIGEGVFFKNVIPLTIVDVNGKFDKSQYLMPYSYCLITGDRA